ncbi:MAG: 50S ribosomal protein L31e [Euryarchaeota archaeon]|nr:50S ribosomal protein L31e [Euryarchaeota archaeon]
MEVNVERIYTIPLHPERDPRWRRSELAIFHIRDYLVRHMKARPDEVHLDSSINEHVFSRGARKPPRHIRVRAMKFEDGIVEAELKQE